MPQQKKKKVKTSLYIDNERMTKLRALSERTLIPISALMRKGIDLVLQDFAKK